MRACLVHVCPRVSHKQAKRLQTGWTGSLVWRPVVGAHYSHEDLQQRELPQEKYAPVSRARAAMRAVVSLFWAD